MIKKIVLVVLTLGVLTTGYFAVTAADAGTCYGQWIGRQWVTNCY